MRICLAHKTHSSVNDTAATHSVRSVRSQCVCVCVCVSSEFLCHPVTAEKKMVRPSVVRSHFVVCRTSPAEAVA